MKPFISIIIPTKNAGENFAQTLEKIFHQEFPYPFEAIIIDSGSTDQTLKIARKYPAKLVQIKPEKFGHGKTRNLGVKLAWGKYLVFLTQDATPIGKFWLKLLTRNLTDQKVAGVYGKQKPRKKAIPLEVYFLKTAYPDGKIRKTLKKTKKVSWKETFFSNANAAIKKEVWLKYKFNESLIMSEDQEWAKKVMLDGYVVVYEPRAAVYHSHNYSLATIFKRNFDSGASMKHITDDTIGSLSWESLKYITKEIKFLLKTKQFLWLPYLFFYESFKFLGFFLGRNEQFFSIALKKKLSLHRSYWR